MQRHFSKEYISKKSRQTQKLKSYRVGFNADPGSYSQSFSNENNLTKDKVAWIDCTLVYMLTSCKSIIRKKPNANIVGVCKQLIAKTEAVLALSQLQLMREMSALILWRCKGFDITREYRVGTGFPDDDAYANGRYYHPFQPNDQPIRLYDTQVYESNVSFDDHRQQQYSIFEFDYREDENIHQVIGTAKADNFFTLEKIIEFAYRLNDDYVTDYYPRILPTFLNTQAECMRQDVFYHTPAVLRFANKMLPPHAHHSALMCLVQLILCKQDPLFDHNMKPSTWFLFPDATMAYLKQNLYYPKTNISNPALNSTDDSLVKTFECLQQLKFHLHMEYNDLFFYGDVTTTPLYQHIYQNIQQCIEQSPKDNINNEEAFKDLADTARDLESKYLLTYRSFYESEDSDLEENWDGPGSDSGTYEGHFEIETDTRTSFWIRSLILLAQCKIQSEKKHFPRLKGSKLSQRQSHRLFSRLFLQNE